MFPTGAIATLSSGGEGATTTRRPVVRSVTGAAAIASGGAWVAAIPSCILSICGATRAIASLSASSCRVVANVDWRSRTAGTERSENASSSAGANGASALPPMGATGPVVLSGRRLTRSVAVSACGAGAGPSNSVMVICGGDGGRSSSCPCGVRNRNPAATKAVVVVSAALDVIVFSMVLTPVQRPFGPVTEVGRAALRDPWSVSKFFWASARFSARRAASGRGVACAIIALRSSRSSLIPCPPFP